ncbi:hypothetical protein DEU29_1243 [Idiomarina aquatica]|uniref:Uncharacterized protein n=1 Tax=Idiomarina aquatica TaxID=1327752 RepID=A0A4R6NWN6_9GAMM|nr:MULTISPECIES: hypothetical protein [Idiomarina]TDP28007.1 hypothetical protein DEU29_1243 [Idiomarina aquatica]
MNINFKASVAALGILASLPSLAAETFQFSSSIYRNGELVKSPVMIVEADKKAYMTIGDDFRYELTVSSKSGDTVKVQTAMNVGSATMNPSLTVFYDKEASVEVGDTKLTVLVSKHESP